MLKESRALKITLIVIVILLSFTTCGFWGLGFRGFPARGSVEFTVDPHDVRDIDIETIDDRVKIETADISQIEIRIPNGYRHQIRDRELIIRQHKRTYDDEVMILIPDGMPVNEIDIETVSGRIDAKDTTSRSFSLSSVSGQIETGGITADEMDLSSVSGSIITEDNSAREIDVETTSGSIDIYDVENAEEIDIDTVSGSTSVTVSDKFGWDVDFDTVSGKLNIPKNMKPYDGIHRISAETVSGSVNITAR